LGFDEVFDYAGGKLDWMGYGLPVEPEQSDETVFDRMLRQFPTCEPGESLAAAKERALEMGTKLCPVVNQKGIVLGVVTEERWDGDSATPVEEAMESGPTTLRPYITAKDADERLVEAHKEACLITSSDGKLMGIFRRGASQFEK
jgi:CBS domain-containing protein